MLAKNKKCVYSKYFLFFIGTMEKNAEKKWYQHTWFRVLLGILVVYFIGLAHYQYMKSQKLTEGSDLPAFSGARVASEVYPISNGHAALIARIGLIESAQKSIDMQYYIWHHDASGMELLARLRRAADRGVKVRLLLDDMDTAGMDALWGSLDNHENIEVHLYNPFLYRTLRFPDFAFDFWRVNQRMHNKAFIVDGKYAIIGGRNIGDEYFTVKQDGANFFDMDVIARGDIVDDTQKNFDIYWNSRQVADISRLIDTTNLSYPLPDFMELSESDRNVLSEIAEQRIQYENVMIQLFSDSPRKHDANMGVLLEQIFANIGTPKKNFTIVSPYFIPLKKGTEWFVNMAKSGARASLLTNSYAATDVGVVHAGYAAARKTLLENGVEIYELKPTRQDLQSKKEWFALSNSSLHAKIFSVDGEKIFIGSLNFDPRSIIWNTEMGYIMEYPALAEKLENAFVDGAGQIDAYKLGMSGSTLTWTSYENGVPTVLETEPGTTWLDRLLVKCIGILPVKWLL